MSSNLPFAHALSLTPVSPSAFNFGIPSLPWINGRDLAGLVLQVPNGSSRIRVGDIVVVPSTDYRDIRKAAFQEYAVATDFNAARIPASTSIHASASVGVAFVASALALGVSFGLDFSLITKSPGPHLIKVISQLDQKDIPADIHEECFAASTESDRPRRGDWIAIWGGKKSYLSLFLSFLTVSRSINNHRAGHAPVGEACGTASDLRS